MPDSLVEPWENDSIVWEFKYDVMGNPVEMIYPDGSKITQEYDIAGRLNRFFNKRGQEISYTYDPDGKLIKKTTPEGDVVPEDSITRRFAEPQRSDANRMIKYEHQVSDVSPIDITATYKYDIFGRRLQKNVNGSTNHPPISADLIGLSPKGMITNFFWENDTMTYELNDQYQPIRKYLTGVGIPKGDSITGYLAGLRYSDAMDDYEGHLEYSEIKDWGHIFRPEYNQPWYSYMKDQVGTINKVHSMKTRAIAESRIYDTFGIPRGDSIITRIVSLNTSAGPRYSDTTSCLAEPRQSDTNLINQTGTATTPLGFQGKYYDAESGLNYFYHRYYNPAIGRFTSEDPIGFGGGGNFFTFVMGDPINAIDRFGLKANCVRKTDWLLTPGPFISDPNNLGELVNTTYHEDYKLSKETNPLPIVSNIINPRGQKSGQIIFICEYNLISILKKETYKKLREFEAIFKCTDSCSGNSWLEKRKDFYDFFYSKESNEQFIGNKKITFPPQLSPCGLLYSRDY